jgi:uncharacterized protein YqhQ
LKNNQPVTGAPCIEKLPSYGGQALIEGVLMRGSRAAAAAMRAPDGKIVIHTEALTGIYKSRWTKYPFIRGVVGLWDALGLGTRYLMMSADLQGDEEEPKKPGDIKNTLLVMSLSIFLGQGMFFTVALSLLIAVGLFFALPALLGHFTGELLGLSSVWSNILEGFIRLGAVVGYIWGVGRIPEIQRVFAYHGAEHKTINAYEAGDELTVENVMRHSLEHPRCGTAFLLTLVILSVLVFTLIGPMSPFLRVASRVLFVPLLAGVAYEYIRWTARHRTSPLVALMMRPNLAMQSLTTRPPTPDIVEVAITAFNAMLEKEHQLLAQGEAKPEELPQPA